MNKIKKNNRLYYGISAGLIGIISNLLLCVVKLLIGLCSHSICIITDAFNNVSDFFSSLLIIIGFKLSNKKENKLYPFGYARYEYLCGFLISLLMLIMGITFLIKSIFKVINPEDLNISIITLVILIISLFIKIFQSYIFKKISIKINSLTLKTIAIESKNDIITDLSILISILIMRIFNINIDGYIGIIISFIIIYSSINMLRENTYLLIGNVDNKLLYFIKNKLLSYNYILNVNNLYIHNYGKDKNYVSVHLKISSKLKKKKINNLIKKIEKDFENNNINLTIQVDLI